jgi:hypothetical protein
MNLFLQPWLTLSHWIMPVQCIFIQNLIWFYVFCFILANLASVIIRLTTGPINAVFWCMLCCYQPVHTPFRCAVEVTTKNIWHSSLLILKQRNPKYCLRLHYFIIINLLILPWVFENWVLRRIDLSGRKWQDAGWSSIKKSFIICLLFLLHALGFRPLWLLKCDLSFYPP